jgi:hypothetical protein
MKLSHVLATAAVATAVLGAGVGTALAVDSNPAPEKPGVTAKETPKTDKVETAKGEPLVQDEKPTAEAPKVETSKGEALVQEEKPAFPEEKLKELKAEQDKAAAKDKEKTPAKDTAKKPLPKTSAVK